MADDRDKELRQVTHELERASNELERKCDAQAQSIASLKEELAARESELTADRAKAEAKRRSAEDQILELRTLTASLQSQLTEATTALKEGKKIAGKSRKEDKMEKDLAKATTQLKDLRKKMQEKLKETKEQLVEQLSEATREAAKVGPLKAQLKALRIKHNTVQRELYDGKLALLKDFVEPGKVLAKFGVPCSSIKESLHQIWFSEDDLSPLLFSKDDNAKFADLPKEEQEDKLKEVYIDIKRIMRLPHWHSDFRQCFRPFPVIDGEIGEPDFHCWNMGQILANYGRRVAVYVQDTMMLLEKYAPTKSSDSRKPSTLRIFFDGKKKQDLDLSSVSKLLSSLLLEKAPAAPSAAASSSTKRPAETAGLSSTGSMPSKKNASGSAAQTGAEGGSELA